MGDGLGWIVLELLLVWAIRHRSARLELSSSTHQRSDRARTLFKSARAQLKQWRGDEPLRPAAAAIPNKISIGRREAVASATTCGGGRRTDGDGGVVEVERTW
jgi:hypothetical protein